MLASRKPHSLRLPDNKLHTGQTCLILEKDFQEDYQTGEQVWCACISLKSLAHVGEELDDYLLEVISLRKIVMYTINSTVTIFIIIWGLMNDLFFYFYVTIKIRARIFHT